MFSSTAIFLLGSPLLAYAQTLTQWVGSTTCGNKGLTLHYTEGDSLTKCAVGELKGYHSPFYTKIECAAGGATLLFFPDANCSVAKFQPQEIEPKDMAKFRAGECVPTKSGCCSYRITDMLSMVLPDCLKIPSTTTTISTTTSIRLTSTTTTPYDCSTLPMSMNGASYPVGCSGAVWSNGSPSKAYCDGEAYPWWSACCKWDGDACTEKEGTATLETTTVQFQDCTTLAPSMNGASFSPGCSGAVWSSGVPSKTYCLGAQGKYPWWPSCCYWDGNVCKAKEGTAVVVTTTTQFHDCTVLPQSMNGASFPSGCSGAVWASGVPSRSYCEGKQGRYSWWGACCEWDEISSACISKHAASGGRRLEAVALNTSEVILV